VNFARLPRQQRFDQVKRICDQLMHAVEHLIPVLPVSLVSAVFVRHSQTGLSAFDVERLANQLIDEIQARGAPVFATTRSRGQNLVAALQMLHIRRLINAQEGKYTADPKSIDVLAYYANALSQWTSVRFPADG
jgi:glycerol-3-phosphate O-acyltransferase